MLLVQPLLEHIKKRTNALMHLTICAGTFVLYFQIVSGSDDRTARIWDLRNMRSPVATIQSDSAVNRLAVSANGLLAIPFDNRNVRIYDMSGQRAGRLPR